ncbi:pyocin activator PrtN family protein [Pseudomonas koreensis]
MNTIFLLMAQYEGRAVIPIDEVCADYMHLSVEKFKRKRLDGEIDIPVVRLGADSQKAALGIHLRDLANYIDRQRAKATEEQDKLMGRKQAKLSGIEP